MGKLFLLFTVVPLLELWLLIAIGNAVGFWPTVLLTLGTAMLGAFLAKREGRRVLDEWRKAVGELREPDEGVLSGVLVLVGAVTLVTPGIITDFTGLLLLFPPTRKLIAEQVRKRFKARMERAKNEPESESGSSFHYRVVTFEGDGMGGGRVNVREGGTGVKDDGWRVTDVGADSGVIDVEGEVVTSEKEPKRLEQGDG